MDEIQGYPDQGLEDFKGFWSLTSNPGGIFFSVYQNGPDQANIGPGVRLTYNFEESNVGNCLEASSGTFTAPVTGHYVFEFSAITGNLKVYSSTNVYKNGIFDREIYDQSLADLANVNHVWGMYLVKNDQVHLQQDHGSLWNNANRFKITWSGQLLLQTEF